ncbi:fimbrial protein, partial [Yersinia pestis]
HHFTATLKKLPNCHPTAGKIDATAYVLVKIQ